MTASADQRVRRLTWAGVELGLPGAAPLYIDPLFGVPPRFAPLLGDRAPFASPGGPAGLVLLTHLHDDHYDPASLRQVITPDTPVLCPAEGMDQLRADGFTARRVQPWDTMHVAGTTVTALPAVDGLGDLQVSWAVEWDGVCAVHLGDTLWHGAWWTIARRLPKIDVVFAPVNGARVNYPWLQPASDVEAAMTARQAAAAAQVLGARLAIPMHHETFHLPPAYVEDPDAESTFLAEAARRGVPARVLAPGQTLRL